MLALLDSLILIVRWTDRGKTGSGPEARLLGHAPSLQRRAREPGVKPSEAHCHRHFPTLSAAKAICKRQQICDSFQ